MKIPFEFFISLRYLRAKRKQSFISAITLISITGVAIGVMALILVLGVMTGFTDDLRQKILGTNAHVVVSSRTGSTITDYRDVMKSVDAVDGIVASTPFLLSQVMVASGTSVSGAGLYGIDVKTAPKVIDIEKTIIDGNIQSLENTVPYRQDLKLPGIIIGKELSIMLGAYPGNPVTLISPSGLLTPAGMGPRWKKFMVVGIFETGMYEYDTSIVYISLANAQKFLKMSDVANWIAIKVKDIYRTGKIVNELKLILGATYMVKDWREMHKNLYAALKLEKTAMFIILILIILVAAFSIVATLIMMVNDKNREIAILKSMGATSSEIMRVFMLQGFVIGLVGTFLGIAGAVVIAFIQDHWHIVRLSADVYYISELVVKIKPWDMFWVSFSAILISFLATVYPSTQAARLDPVEALRYE